jgi:hypothetical protein
MSLSGKEVLAYQSAVADLPAGKKLADVMNKFSDGAFNVAFSVSAEVSNIVTVTIDVTAPDGQPLAAPALLEFLVVSSVTTFAPTATDYTTIAATTGSVLEISADKLLRVVTNAVGRAVLTFTLASGAATNFLAFVRPGGSLVASAAIVHA